MKLKTFVIFFLCLVAVGASAQIIYPRAGVAISTMTYEPSIPNSEIHLGTSFTFGLGAEFRLVKNLHLLVESNYLSREYRYYTDNPFGSGRQVADVSYRHNYVDVPIQLKRYFGNSPFKFYFTAGGYVGIGLGGTKEGRLRFLSSAGNTYMDLEGEVSYSTDSEFSQDLYYHYYDSRLDAGVMAGAGLVLFKVAVLDVRYEFGLVKIDNEDMNRSFQIALSVPLKLKPAD